MTSIPELASIRLRVIVRRMRVALVVCLIASPLTTLAASDAELAATVRQLLQRVQLLEERNKVLEQRMQQLGAGQGRPGETARMDAAPTGSSTSPSVPSAVSSPMVSSAAVPTARLEPSFEFALTAVGQQVNAGGRADGRRQSRINYRGDLLATVPAGSLGAAQGTAVGQLRFGQGTGVALRPTYTGAVNSTTFEARAGSDQTYAIVAQAYYQLEWSPMRAAAAGSDKVELTIGKLDLFGFFDQNAAADDESSQFLNNVFVHNPLLDSGGDIAADAYGFQPGVRLAWSGQRGSAGWGASIGVFAAGEAADFNGSPSRPLVIGQLEYSPRSGAGDEPSGNYRVYVWSNGRTTDLAGDRQRHTGIGLSIDQRLGRDSVLFGRVGKRTRGDGQFDRAITLGIEQGGSAWGRADDALGAAVGWLPTGSAWRRATAADSTLVGHAAAGNERVAELYYRLRLSPQLAISPDFQLIERPAGDGRAPTIRVFGVRASLGF
jgi:high affinity Mn2+ porin